MTEKRIHLVLLDEWPCPGSHYLHTKKFLSSFKVHGYGYSEIKELSDLENIKSSDIVYLSDHGFSTNNFPSEIMEKISRAGCSVILWFWHDHLDLARQLFENRFILTGEHFYSRPTLPIHINRWNIQINATEYVPLTFASNLLPSKIGTYERNEKYLAHFIGNGYKHDLNKRLRRRFIKVKYLNTPPFITEEERVKIFLSSKVALGWHSDDNIQNNVIVERVFEGLAYGNVVISDSPMAPEVTDGIVEFMNTYDETKEFLLRIKRDEKFRLLKTKAGQDWAKSKGTYSHVAKNFIDKFSELG